ncbi:nucleolar complex protein 14 [Tulasnella sp. 418]|nr:nucleolar complex protein 14 [Tulasnella sp. 418]
MVKAGSQLSQLKAALSQAGLSRKSQPSTNKKKRSSGSILKTKADKAKDAAKLAAIQQKLNPFDVKVTKVKNEVKGQKLKGVIGRPGMSKQAGIEQRRKTLLVEYDKRSRAGGLIDRRFGENDPNMTPEEKMLERFTKERQRASKVNFNLEDDEDLTHYGQSLSAMDDFDGAGLALDEDEDDNSGMSKHFSSSRTYERQLQKVQDDSTRHQLDQEFHDIQRLLFQTPPDPSATGSNSLPLGKPRHHAAGEDRPAPEMELEQKDDDYDQFVRELVFEKRAKPTDRLKTEEETALEEKEKLEKAERARIRRMNGEDVTDSEEEGSNRRKRRHNAQADDLDDDFMEDDGDDAFALGAGLGAHIDADGTVEDQVDHHDPTNHSAQPASDDDDEDDEETDDSEDALEEELTDEDNEGVETGDDGSFDDLVSSRKTGSASKSTRTPVKELPFTFECPETHEEFLDILDGVDDSDVPTVIHRIRTIHHPSLAEGNKAKLAVFTTILIDHLAYITAPPNPSFSLLSLISPHIFSLCKSYPVEAAQAFISKLSLMQKNLVRGISHAAQVNGAKTYPGTAELSILRMIGAIWSTSDLSHPVVAPAMLLMGQYLAQCRIRGLQDLASGLFLCTIFLQYQALSKRVVPEGLNFLYTAILHLGSHSFTPETLPGTFPDRDLFDEGLTSMRLMKSASRFIPEQPQLSSLLNNSTGSEQNKVDLLGLAFQLLGRFAQLYKSSEGFIEMFTPGVEILEGTLRKGFSPALQKTHGDLKDSLTKMIKFAAASRQPLFLQAHKPIAIATYVPKFEVNYSDRKHHDPDRERNASAKLKALYKKEKKSAMKELRKDNRFLAMERTKRQEEKDRDYHARMARVAGEIQSERHEQKVLEKAKMREKKRAGRK